MTAIWQGHESSVIILSLVRNNSKNKIGFLCDKHCHVVAVSRQKCGMYIVGSAKCLSESSPIVWKVFYLTVKCLTFYSYL